VTEGFSPQPIHASIIEPWSLVNGSHPTGLLRAFPFLFACFLGGSLASWLQFIVQEDIL
jgi:hypothetical protein